MRKGYGENIVRSHGEAFNPDDGQRSTEWIPEGIHDFFKKGNTEGKGKQED